MNPILNQKEMYDKNLIKSISDSALNYRKPFYCHVSVVVGLVSCVPACLCSLVCFHGF